MAVNGSSSSISISQPLIPNFKGECCEFWRIKMKTLFRSQDLWDLVESGYDNNDADGGRLREKRRKIQRHCSFFNNSSWDNFFPESQWHPLQRRLGIYCRKKFEALLLKGSFQAHEARRNRSAEKNEEKAFQASQVKGETDKKQDSAERRRGRGRGRCRFDGQERQFVGKQKWNKNSIQCYNCKIFGHIKAHCREGSQANFV